MMDYTNVLLALDRLEKQIVTAPGATPGGVRRNHSPIQGFALDIATCGRQLPVIVALGVNYTQGEQLCPRDRGKGNLVADDLKACRGRLTDAIESYKQSSKTWHRYGKASAPCISIPENFHFVMANFCLWITHNRWLKTASEERAQLLANNPPFGGARCDAPAWPHLVRLSAAIAPAIWVAHGMHSEVFALFDAVAPHLSAKHWLKTPNLGYRYFHYGTHFPRL